jgi:hypothetical protein
MSSKRIVHLPPQLKNGFDHYKIYCFLINMTFIKVNISKKFFLLGDQYPRLFRPENLRAASIDSDELRAKNQLLFSDLSLEDNLPKSQLIHEKGKNDDMNL